MVPKLVQQRAAPAGNACNGFACARASNEENSAIGEQLPVNATPLNTAKFDLTALKEVERRLPFISF